MISESLLFPTSHTLFTSPINIIFTPNESLNTMKDIKVTKLDNFIIKSIINPILLVERVTLKVFRLSPILELKNSFKN